VVLTALFARADVLRSPHHRVDTETVGCYFAFVDQQSAHMLLGQRPRTKASFEPDGATGVDGASMEALVTVGVWRLIVLAAEGLPYREARRNSRVPKLLVHRFFPEAAFAIWVDAKLELRMAPTDAVRRFLLAPRAEVAAVRNLRRNTIAHEHAWIYSWMCSSPLKMQDETCTSIVRQWDTYQREQAADADWALQTSVIEGALMIYDLRSVATRCFLCNWHQEYSRFSERDQLSFSYVLHTQRPRPHVYFIPRRLHWSVVVQGDTLACYNATLADALSLARRFQHFSMSSSKRWQPPGHRRP